MTHVIHYFEEKLNNELINLAEIDYFCSEHCMVEILEALGVDLRIGDASESLQHLVSWGEAPCAVYCATCGEPMNSLADRALAVAYSHWLNSGDPR